LSGHNFASTPLVKERKERRHSSHWRFLLVRVQKNVTSGALLAYLILMNQPSTRLLLVYNADGGILNAIKDAINKQVSPRTYRCSLCAITYGAVSMHGEWRRFLASLNLGVVFHHRDDFSRTYPDLDIALPAILIAECEKSVRLLLSAKELDTIADAAELMTRLEEKLVIERLRSPGAP
jgi:hypothetical protein